MPSDAARTAACGVTLDTARSATVYTNAPEQLREAVFGDLCTLLRHHGRPRESRVATVYTNGPERLREDVFGDLCTLLHYYGAPA